MRPSASFLILSVIPILTSSIPRDTSCRFATGVAKDDVTCATCRAGATLRNAPTTTCCLCSRRAHQIPQRPGITYRVATAVIVEVGPHATALTEPLPDPLRPP